MKQIGFFVFLGCMGYCQLKAQDNRTTSMFLGIEHNFVLTHPTRLANPSLTGINFEMYFNRKRQFQPVVNLSALDELQSGHFNGVATDNHGAYLPPLGRVVNLFSGIAYLPSRRYLISLVAGPTFLRNETLLGVKPSVGFYLGKYRRFAAQVSYLKLSQSKNATNRSLQALGASFTVRLY